MADPFPARLADEVARWVHEGLITAEQGQRILGRYPVSAPSFSRPIIVLSLIGGALIAGGIALVVAHNWEEIHRGVKLGGVVILMVLADLGGLGLREREYPKMGEGILLIGGILLLVGIALIGQIYNLSGRPSDAVLLWWLLLLPVAYTLPSIALGGLGYLGAASWYGMMLFDPTTWLGHVLEANIFSHPIAFATAGILYFGLGMRHGPREYRGLRRLLEQLGLLALFAALLVLGFRWSDSFAPRSLGDGSGFALVILLVPALVGILLAASRLPRDSATARTGFAIVLLALFLYLLGLEIAIGLRAPIEVFRALAYFNWLLMFATALAFVLYGARWERTSWINWGVLFIGADALARYIDLFGTMLQTSLLFFTSGVFVLLLGWGLERMRRRMTAHVVSRRGNT